MTGPAARQRFCAARVARLATADRIGTPHLVPVTFAVLDSTDSFADGGPPAENGASALIVFAVDHKPKSTTALRRLANIAANPRVAFLVDHYDEDWDRLWWVRADALARTLDGDDRGRAVTALVAKYPQYLASTPGGVVIGAAVTGWRGWQGAAGPAPPDG